MDQDLTLEMVTPRMPLKNKVILGAVAAVVAAVLIASYLWTGISPLKLYHKRGNAFTYLFGRQLTEMEREDLHRQAERLPEVFALEDARSRIRTEYRRQGKPAPDAATLSNMAEQRAEEYLARMPAKERENIVQEEYERAVKEKKGGYFPPETALSSLKSYSMALLETVAIAIWGSLLAFLVAIPVSLFAARNTLELLVQGDGTAARWLRWFCQFGVRRFLDFCRGFNEFVMALIFVAVIGLGPFAGVMALAIHTFGILGKVFSEAIEAIEPGQVEAVLSSGAGSPQVISFAVMPQVMPLIISYSLLRFESNVRSATILGFVGAGGIGFLMFDKINGYRYQEVATMMIMVIICVTIIDYLCGMLRRRFV